MFEEGYLDKENDDVGNQYLIHARSLLNILSRYMGETSKFF